MRIVAGWFLARVALSVMVAGAAAMPGLAADKPGIAPAPAWVKPIAVPDEKATAAGNGAAVRVLLHDQQAKLDRGRISIYTASAFRIQTPEGLAAGNISLAWQPETDEVTVHKLLIRHADGRSDDVLASGQTFTVVRREANLESAMLDGVLTANIQPEGLQVGDTVELQMTQSSSDPVLKGHVAFIGGTWNTLPIDRAHLSALWSPEIPVRVQPSAAIPAMKIARGNLKSGLPGGFEILLNAIDAVPPPRFAPGRYRIGRAVEVSDFASWAELSALFAPLYDKAGTLPAAGPLADEAAKIKALSPDPVIRAQAVLRLVEDRVRYVALLMGAGGYTPADAATTWSRRFGDCKAKSALLLALLRNMGIKADAVLVNAYGIDGLDERLPMVTLFNHVIVRAEIGGRTYWLDATRTGDRRLDQLETPALGWGLPVVASGGALVRLLPPPYDKPTSIVTIRIDAREGVTIPAPTTVEWVITGDEAFSANSGMNNLSADARDRSLREYWKKQYDFIDIHKVGFSYDPDKREIRYTMEGDARMEWKDRWYETDGTGVGYRADFSREPGPGRDAPYVVSFPFHIKNIETILLPPFYRNYEIPAKWQVNETAGGIEYRRKATLDGTTFTVESSSRSIVPEFAAKDAPAAQAALRALAGNDIYLYKSDNYPLTDKELAAASGQTFDTAQAYVTRGNAQADRKHYKEAIADYEKALAIEAQNARALAGRGLARLYLGDIDAAAKDVDRAIVIAPRNRMALIGSATVAAAKQDSATVIKATSALLESEPSNAYGLALRAIAYRSVGDGKAAALDADAAIKAGNTAPDLYLIMATDLTQKGDRPGAAAQAAALVAAQPDSDYAHVAAARIYQRIDRMPDAMREFDRAIAIKPEAYIYLNRSNARPRADVAGRRQDLDLALKLGPASQEAIIAKATLEQQAGNPALAAAILTKSALADADSYLLTKRGIAYLLAGQQAKADQDFAAARARAKSAGELNNICFEKAKAGVALADALGDCDAALAKQPDSSAALDSRAFVLLRLGRYDEAIADYGKALVARPALADSLLGRAIAWARKGDKAKSELDLAAARKSDPSIETTFADYGVTL